MGLNRDSERVKDEEERKIVLSNETCNIESSIYLGDNKRLTGIV